MASDTKLFCQAREGSDEAFSALVSKYQARLVSVATRYLRDPDEAQDVAQEACLKAHRALKTFRGDSSFYTWIYRITVNTAQDYLAARKRRPPAVDIAVTEFGDSAPSAELIETETPESALQATELQQQLQDAISTLPVEQRQTAWLRWIKGMSYKDIADIVGCQVTTARTRCFYAQKTLIENKKQRHE